jgi:hypothetical protein
MVVLGTIPCEAHYSQGSMRGNPISSTLGLALDPASNHFCTEEEDEPPIK